MAVTKPDSHIEYRSNLFLGDFEVYPDGFICTLEGEHKNKNAKIDEYVHLV